MIRHTIDSDAFSLPSCGIERLDVAVTPEHRLDIVVVRNGPGPRVLVVGGTHGDEFEGQIATLELARSLPDLIVCGTLIVLPLHNPAAARAGHRRSPTDLRDLNRAYGSARQPGPTQSIADFVSNALLPEVDIVIDLHSGGRTHAFVLSSNLQATPGGPEWAEMRPMLMAFGAPYAITFDEAGEDGMPHKGTLEGLVRTLGKRALSSEIGGSGGVTAASVAVARQGLTNVLHHVGSISSPLAMDWRDSPSVELSLTLPHQHEKAPCAGWFVPHCQLGDVVSAGSTLGCVLPDDDPLAEPLPVVATTTGTVVALFHPVRCVKGEVIVYVAASMPKTSADF
jgi:predicted deacylase